MGFKIILTPQSQDDLREIVSFIARHNRQRTKSFGNELIDRALTLANYRNAATSCRKYPIQQSAN